MAIRTLGDVRALIEDVFTEIEERVDTFPRPRRGAGSGGTRSTGPDGADGPDGAAATDLLDAPERAAVAEPRNRREPDPAAAPPGTTATDSATDTTTDTIDAGGPDTPDQPETAYIEKWGLPLAVVVIGMFMSVLDVSIVNVAIPAMQKAFNVNAEDIAWVATAYTLVLGVIVPTSAWLGERLGLRRLYVWSLVSFALFSGLCALADDLGPMIAFRILQAIPGGVIPVLCLAILTRIVPPAQLGAAMGMYGFGMVVAPGVGPALGGYLVEYVDWRWIFVINVPIGLLGAVAAQMALPELPGRKGKSFDTWGFVTVAAGLFAVLLAVSKGQDWGWTSYPVLILLVFSALSLALFVFIELEVEHPLLNVRSFRHWQFVNSLLVVGALSLGLFASLYFVPVFLQEEQEITPMNTGLAILPQAVVMMALMPVAGKLYDRFGARWPAVAGCAVSAVGLLLMGGFDADTKRSEVVVWTMIQAGGLSLAFMPVMTAGLAALPEKLVDAGNSYHNLVQRVAGALGLSAITALTMSWTAQNMADYSSLVQDRGMSTNTAVQSVATDQVGMMSAFMRTQLLSTAESYATAFLVLGIITGLTTVPALLLPTGRPAAGDKPMVEMG